VELITCQLPGDGSLLIQLILRSMMRYLYKLGMPAVLASFNLAWAADASNTRILTCVKTADDAQRLRCFDREAAVLLGAPPSAPPVKLTPEQKLGLPRAQIDAIEAPPKAPAEITNFTAAIKSVSVEPPGRQVFTLDNGQVWREDQTGQSVRIRKGSLGSFFLDSQTHSHLSIRVTRVR
jgi:hypothetical protein